MSSHWHWHGILFLIFIFFPFSDGANGSNGTNGANGTNGSMGLIKKADINKRYARTLYNKQCSVAFPISASSDLHGEQGGSREGLILYLYAIHPMDVFAYMVLLLFS